jgi:hypothetical protein
MGESVPSVTVTVGVLVGSFVAVSVGSAVTVEVFVGMVTEAGMRVAVDILVAVEVGIPGKTSVGTGSELEAKVEVGGASLLTSPIPK